MSGTKGLPDAPGLHSHYKEGRGWLTYMTMEVFVNDGSSQAGRKEFYISIWRDSPAISCQSLFHYEVGIIIRNIGRVCRGSFYRPRPSGCAEAVG